jgi:hypothetical protein
MGVIGTNLANELGHHLVEKQKDSPKLWWISQELNQKKRAIPQTLQSERFRDPPKIGDTVTLYQEIAI